MDPPESHLLPIAPQRPLVRPASHFRAPLYQEVDHRTYISFFHPGYSTLETSNPDDSWSPGTDSAALLISLPAYDNRGFHHGTALSACSIIAGNRLGYFTEDAPTGTRVREPPDFQLPAAHRYYYHLTEEGHGHDPRYPICPSFDQWPFRSSTIPGTWKTAFSLDVPDSLTPVDTPSNMSQAVHARDRACRVTGAHDITDNAHIIPTAESAWFLRNAMFFYNTTLKNANSAAIHDVANGLLLRRDIHHAFDKRLFCPVVKEGKLVNHFLFRTTELAGLYHNAEFRMPEADRCVEFMWARFAWTILHLMSQPTGKRVRLRDGTVVPWEEMETVEDEHETPKTKRKAGRTPKAAGKRAGKGKGKSAAVPEAKKTRLDTSNQVVVCLDNSEQEYTCCPADYESDFDVPNDLESTQSSPDAGEPPAPEDTIPRVTTSSRPALPPPSAQSTAETARDNTIKAERFPWMSTSPLLTFSPPAMSIVLTVFFSCSRGHHALELLHVAVR